MIKAAVGTLDEVALLGMALADEEDAQGFVPSVLSQAAREKGGAQVEINLQCLVYAASLGAVVENPSFPTNPTTKVQLSVCIATRNRAVYIGDTIRSIFDEAFDGVEVIVLDGASTDATPEIVQSLQQSFPMLRYERRETNGGVDRDYDAAVSLARGEYCWLMSDDDVLKPDAIRKVLELISRGYSLLVVNSELRNLDLTELIDASRLRFDSDRVYGANEFNRLFVETSAYLGYIGAVVIRRELWLARDREPYFGSNFIHVGVIFQQPLPGSAIALHEPLIEVRFGNTQWRPREFEIRMVCWTTLVNSLSAVPETVRRQTYPREPWRSLKSLFFYRAKGTYGLGEYRRLVRPRVHGVLDRARAFTVACFPGSLANLAGLAFCHLPYRDANIHLLDMKASRFFYRNWFKRPAEKAR